MKAKKEIVISNATKDRVEACKTYIERKYAKQLKEEQSKKQNWDMLFQRMS
jgi:serine/threonine kinase 38